MSGLAWQRIHAVPYGPALMRDETALIIAGTRTRLLPRYRCASGADGSVGERGR